MTALDAIRLTKAQAAMLDRLDNPAAALLALTTKFKGDKARWLAWLRWLDDGGFRAE